MAQFYAEIQGNRGRASRVGSKGSGIWGHIRGWNDGKRSFKEGATYTNYIVEYSDVEEVLHDETLA